MNPSESSVPTTPTLPSIFSSVLEHLVTQAGLSPEGATENSSVEEVSNFSVQIPSDAQNDTGTVVINEKCETGRKSKRLRRPPSRLQCGKTPVRRRPARRMRSRSPSGGSRGCGPSRNRRPARRMRSRSPSRGSRSCGPPRRAPRRGRSRRSSASRSSRSCTPSRGRSTRSRSRRQRSRSRSPSGSSCRRPKFIFKLPVGRANWKRPPAPFILFFTERLCAERRRGCCPSVIRFAKEMGAIWCKMGPKEKGKYYKKFAAEMQRMRGGRGPKC